MNVRALPLFTAFAALSLLVNSSFGQLLYSENFDDGLATNRWTAHAGVGFNQDYSPGPMDTNFDAFPFTPSDVDGINEDFSGFAYDYSVVGIPSAPNSTGGSTTGLKLQANIFSDRLGGFSASPNGLNLTGDYSVTFDAWASTLGPFPGGGSGSTNLSTFGVLTAGTASNTLLNTDGVFFAYTGDGGSGADYRVYSVADNNSYDLAELDATYHAGSRNASAALYSTAFGPGTTVPASVVNAVQNNDVSGTLQAGAAGMAWHENEIRVVGDSVDWLVNDVLLVTLDTSSFTGSLGGGNLSFGHTDINFTSTTDIVGALEILFTLIDNIEVNTIVPSLDNADFNGDTFVDGTDFLTWQRGFGINDGTALLADGDATGDGNVLADDLTVWQSQYGSAPPLSAVTAVPEPATWLTLVMMAIFGLPARVRVRRRAL